jgi:hypothetical protein
MSTKPARWLLAACMPWAVLAQEAAPLGRWLDSGEAQAFRQRVVQLALIYGESTGIDPRGLRVVTHRITQTTPGCGRVQVQAFEGERLVLEAIEAACRH